MRVLALLAAATLVWCSTPGPAPAPQPDPVPSRAPVPTPAPTDATCATACAHLMAIHCEDGNPTDEGASCEAVCQNAADNGSPLPVACVIKAADCEAAAECEDP